MGIPTAPDYDNVRMPGADGLRIPTEMAPATFLVKKGVYLTGAAATGTVTLRSELAGASYFSISNTPATTLVFPSIPDHEFVVNNLAASSGSVTVEVSGQSATPIAVAAGFLQSFVIDKNLGVVPTSAAVAV
jgi:hypothetical protein